MNTIQNLSFGSVTVSFNQAGFLNATQIAKYFHKRPETYLKTEQTQQYIVALSEHLSNTLKSVIDENQLVIVKSGSSKNGGGTWLHPKLAIHFARWLDPRFAVWCDGQIEQILSGRLKPALPHGSLVLSAYDVHALSALLKHLPFMMAYAQKTQTAVRSLNHELAYRTHDRFQDGYIFASQLAKSLNLPMRSWHDALDMLG
ncbi:KilA-N domain [Kingella potus]|uniref:KilA-N domain n=1 Tax=Kingella potus TaxID=265175 RepID=A0A377R613_9NEIS|nr:KilA-N domain-containing protein [Kingella potus]UOP01999.1 KilA-N domain-containing protein [Kingella potus]STR03422.1 KilA-N domain [Kingella potus]